MSDSEKFLSVARNPEELRTFCEFANKSELRMIREILDREILLEKKTIELLRAKLKVVLEFETKLIYENSEKN